MSASIPVVEFFRGDNYGLVPNVAIGSRGPVLSVTLFSKVPWEEIRSVRALDEGRARTSRRAGRKSCSANGVWSESRGASNT